MTDLSWLPKVLIPAAVFLILGLFRKLAPAPDADSLVSDYDHRQGPEPLPAGVIGAFMWGLAVLLVLSFFLLRWANHAWGQMDGPADLRIYEPAVIWCFLPGFAALAVPWPFTVWLLRRLGRFDEANGISARSNEKSGMDSMRVMKWLSLGLVGPIAIFTLLAIPMHLSIADTEARLGHYASLSTERFPFNQARRATLVEGYRDRSGTFHPSKDLIMDFADGPRLRANAAGDGGTNVPDEVVSMLLAKSGLPLTHAQTEYDIPAN